MGSAATQYRRRPPKQSETNENEILFAYRCETQKYLQSKLLGTAAFAMPTNGAIQ